MPYIAINQLDDFLQAARPKYELRKWKDISMNLQEYYFASRLFSKAGPREMAGPEIQWRLQIAYNDTYKTTGLYADDVTVRQDLLTHGKMSWSLSTANYTYDKLENVFRQSDVEIIDYMITLEHGMYNSYFAGRETEMMGAGPTSPTQSQPPPTSLLWWIQPYNTASGYGNNDSAYQLASGATSGFLGMNPFGFDSVGTGSIDRKTYSGWRNRIGRYTDFTDKDAVNTIIECMDKCGFTNAHAYPDLAPSDGRPTYELLTTYSRVQAARDLLAAGNDNIRNALDRWKIDVPMLRGAPMHWIPAWTKTGLATSRTDGMVLGVDWSSFTWYSAAGLRMVKQPIQTDAHKHNVRWQFMDDSGQLVCYDCRRNFAVNCTATVTEQD